MGLNVVDHYGFDPTGAADNADKFTAMALDMSSKAARPRLNFPEGIYSYSACPNLAFPNLEIVGDGHVELRYTGTGNALTFDGDAANGGVFNMWVEGLHVVPTAAAADTVVITAVHHSYFRIKAHGAGAPRGQLLLPCKAISAYWCVATEFYFPTVTPFDAAHSLGGGGSYDCIGLWLDTVMVPAHWQTTDCRIVNPVIESCRIGVQINDAGGCMLMGGTVESCTDTGIVVATGGQNRAWGTWVEGNKNYDVWFGVGAKANDLWLSHPSNLKIRNDNILGGNIAHGTGIFGT